MSIAEITQTKIKLWVPGFLTGGSLHLSHSQGNLVKFKVDSVIKRSPMKSKV